MQNNLLTKTLNKLLSEELGATHSYMLHARVLHHTGYVRLAEEIKRQAIDEMHHAQTLMDRILFLDGKPEMSLPGGVNFVQQPQEILAEQRKMETAAIASYKEGITAAHKVSDFITARMLEHILADEEKHLDWLDVQLNLIDTLGFAEYAASLTVSLKDGGKS